MLRGLWESGAKAARRDRHGRLARAKLRHAVMTLLPNQISGGSLLRRHLAHAPVCRKLEVWIPAWPARFDGVRIGHLSDLHVGHLMPAARALEAVELLAQSKPDLLACTGDVVDLEVAGSEPVFRALGSLRAPMGRYFVLGNHDLLDSARRVLRMARSSGLSTLRSEAEVIKGGLRIGGIDWGRTLEDNARSVRTLVRRCAPPHLLLAHNPKAFREAVRHRVPLTLAGHTHGAQFSLMPKFRQRSRSAESRALLAGHYHDGESHLFVTTGVGGWFPLRVNCPAEVVIVTVRRGNARQP